MDDCDVGLRQMRSVPEDCAGAIQQPNSVKPLHQPAAESLARDAFVDRILGHMNVDASSEPHGNCDALLEGFLVQRETRMRAHHSGEVPGRTLLAQSNVAFSFRKTCRGFIWPVAVGD